MTTLLKLGLLMEDFNMKILYALILSMSVIIANAQEPGGTYEDFLASQNLSAKKQAHRRTYEVLTLKSYFSHTALIKVPYTL